MIETKQSVAKTLRILWDDIKCDAIIIFSKIPTIDTPLLAHTAMYGVSFFSLNSNLYSPSVSTVVYEILCNTGPRYKSTRMYED